MYTFISQCNWFGIARRYHKGSKADYFVQLYFEEIILYLIKLQSFYTSLTCLNAVYKGETQNNWYKKATCNLIVTCLFSFPAFLIFFYFILSSKYFTHKAHCTCNLFGYHVMCSYLEAVLSFPFRKEPWSKLGCLLLCFARHSTADNS